MKIIFGGDSGIQNTSIYFVALSIKSRLEKKFVSTDKIIYLEFASTLFDTIKIGSKIISGIFSKVLFLRTSKQDILFLFHTASPFYKLLSFRSAYKVALVHDLFFIDYYKDMKSFIVKLYLRGMVAAFWKKSLQRYQLLLVLSEQCKKDLVSYGFDEKKIEIIWNGIHDIFFDAKTTPMKLEHDYILVLGNELTRKNMKGSLEAFAVLKKKYPNLLFIKIGYGTMQTHRKNTMQIIQALDKNVQKDIQIIDDKISIHTLKQYYQGAKCLLFPSFEEGFGLPIVEAQASGTVVITSNVTPMSSLVPYKDMLVNPYNVQDIANKCDMILSDDVYREDCIQKGKAFVQKYRWDSVVNKIEEIFQERGLVIDKKTD